MTSPSGSVVLGAPCLPPPGPSARETMSRLDQEWESLRETPAAWLTPSPSLDDLLAGIRSDPNRLLGDLISACQSGYLLAGRVVIQALLPKLLKLTRSWPFPSLDHLLSALWVRIATYPLARRPQAVAANLTLDTRKDILAETKAAPLVLPAEPTPTPTARAIISTARQLQLVKARPLAIVEKVYLEGLPKSAVAEVFSISEATVRKHCSATVRQLRNHRRLLAEAAT